MHKANLTYKQQVDSGSVITLFTAGAYGRNKSSQDYAAADNVAAGNFLNQTALQADQLQDQRNYILNFLWQKKFKKPGRTLSVAWDNVLDYTEGGQQFLSVTNYYNGKPVADSNRILNLF